MFAELPPFVANALIGIVAALVYVMAWRSVSGRTGVEPFVIRLVLAGLLIPFVLAAVLGSFHKDNEQPRAGASRPTITSAPAPAPVPRKVETVEAARPVPPPVAQSAPPPPPVAVAPPPIAQAPAPPREPVTVPAQSPAAAPAPGQKQLSQQEIIEQLTKQQGGQVPIGNAQTRAFTGKDATRATPAPASDQWDVVPVYYGTDRKSIVTGDRLEYGSDRGRKLEVGGALVTVPKSHEVPNVERPWVYRLPFTQIVLMREKEDPAKHFTLKEVKALTQEELAKVVRDRIAASRDFKGHAFVFVHGFNTTFEAALFRTAQISYDLGFDGAPFLYSWPSKGQIGLQDYSYDRESSGQAEPYLKQFLTFVARETGATSVSVIAHSMGNQVLMPVLRDLKRTAPEGVNIDQIILAAPDVDRDTFEFLAKEITGVGKGITMLAASNDRALEASRRFWGGIPRAGDVPLEGPIVVPGVDTIDVTATSTEMLSLNHSGYAQKQQLIDDMRLLLRTGDRPPQRRLPDIERVTTPKGDFWRYPAPR